MAYLVSPTVLVVDDQKRYGESLKKALLNLGSVGSMFVAKLDQAADMILDERYHFDALLTDVSFEEGDDPRRHLHDGLDLIEFAQKERPSIERYAYSAHIETAGYEAKIARRNIDVRKFFDKRRINMSPQQHEQPDQQPWNVVRADIIRKQIEADPSLIDQLNIGEGRSLADQGVLERVVSTLRPPTITYIQHLNDRFVVKIPIQVICAPDDDDGVVASAPKLGILVDGVGKTPSEAVDNLRDVIAAHCESLFDADAAEIRGYAELVRDELLKHLELRKKDAA